MKYWLWIIPVDREATQDLWDFCLTAGVAAMQYEVGVQKKAEYNRALAQQIAVGDQVVAYLNQNRVGGVGTVTRPFFDGPTGYQSSYGYPYGQRIGVDWLATEASVDIRMVPGVIDKLGATLHFQTIHEIDKESFDRIAEAVQTTRENPLPKIADLLESVPLDDVACREAEPWAKQIEPITRPFLEYLGRIIKIGMLLRQDIELVFKTKPRQVKKQASTRDSVSFRVSGLGFEFGVRIGWSPQGFEDRFVWGLFWWGANDDAPVIKEMLDYVKSAGETVVCEVDTVFGGTNCGIFKSLAASELREAHPVKLSHQIFEDLEQMYRELKIGFPEQGMKRLMTFMSDRGFHFPAHLVTTYFLSLQTKPFVILTGISGTGKTKLAQLFAEWMSPMVETEVTVSESPEPTDTSFYIEIKPYMLKYSRAVVPVGVWQYFDVPELGQSTQVRLAYPGGEEVCKLGLQPHPQNPNGYLQLLFKGGLRRWMRDNLAVGDLLMIETIGEEGEAYRLEKYRPQTRTVVERERNYAFVPVRPDWTDSRGLLGFHNLITGTYSATDFLRLLLRAAINLQSARPRPYFVILDEMNLAKVEYYFADFLSAMESRRLGEGGNIEQERLILHNQPRCVLAAGNEEVVDASYYHEERFTCLVKCEECPFATFVDEGYHHDGEFDYEEARATGFTPQHFVPPRLTVPLNVYFAGTVNVDETTYMFSPKVLDRANTIEFGDVHLDTYFSVAYTDGATASTADEQTIEIFANNRQFTLLPKQVPELRSDPELAPYRDQLVRLNQLLKPFEMHFGYRVADEVLLYLWNAQELNDPAFSLDVAFDHQIYQKVLPKFHGSQAKLREPLEALRAFCEEHGYALSGAKIQRMLGMLMKEGFASFA
jgi:5-methylcytosine-specific restriction endonuclease McrBC GTP-binding regulatory subunit McrB